ncbi:MAG TPA: trypsin-like peptidase domain-containing protein [Kofleriaceae bacterium]|nr:trypsin-like peptidase domain-containing protein [Kofleriaceae bacterium]
MKNASQLLIAFVAVGVFQLAPKDAAADSHAAAVLDSNAIADVAEKMVDSVVNISTESVIENEYEDPFSQFFGGPSGPMKAEGKGSGVIVTASGRILTNAHVVNGATHITVTLQDGTELPAKVVGKDTRADLAVIQLDGKVPALKPIPWGDSSSLRLGEIVLAIGDGLGVGKSVSMGIVSAKGRGLRIAEYEDFIQTDAAINPGNSGGALVNLKGELVGINTAIASRSGGYQGIGFAIPTNMAKPIMEQLMKDGHVSRGYLGVGIATVNAALATEYQLPAQKGVLVASVEDGSPADKAGLIAGDIVTAINGAAVRTDDALKNTIAAIKPGTSIDLDVIHKDGKTASVKAKLAELPEQSRASIAPQIKKPAAKAKSKRMLTPLTP